MRKLSERYWDRFITLRKFDKKNIRDGILFEDLIGKLLELEYPAAWKRTKKSHDYNRDFYLTTDSNVIWAECKNYQNEIALSTIAPTLVMAQIFAVNKIIFFSYSLINTSARKKIYAFALKNNKDVYILDEGRLDELIIKHKKNLPNIFRPRDIDIIYLGIQQSCEISFFFVQDPIIGSSLEERLITPLSEVEKINYNNIFEIVVYMEPSSISSGYRYSITAESMDDEINNHYQIVDIDNDKFSQLNISHKLDQSSGRLQCILLKPLFFHKTISLPIIKVKIFCGDELIESKKSPYRKVKMIWSRQTLLIGEEYRNLVLNFENSVLDNSRLGCFTIYGHSGVGKTRILKESLDILLKHKYQITSFIGNEHDSSQTILKEIIYYIYEVPREDIFEILEDRFEQNDITESSIVAYRLAKKISKSMCNADLYRLIDEYFDIIYEKLSSIPIAIVIDNLQFFDSPLMYFLQKYIDYSKHQIRTNRSVLLFSINTDYMNSGTQKFMDYIEELKKDRSEFIKHEIIGFSNENQSVLFLQQLLNIEGTELNAQLRLIAQKSSYNPYYIYQIIYSLLDEQIIRYSEDNRASIIDIKRFYTAIEKMPDSIYQLLEKRWNKLLSDNPEKAYYSKCIFSLISLLGPLDKQKLHTFKINRKTVQWLCQNAILHTEEKEFINFDHDIIEKFFLQFYFYEYYEILDYIVKNNLEKQLHDYPILMHLFLMHQDQITSVQLKEAVEFFCNNNLPYKVTKDYFECIFKRVINQKDLFSSPEEWLIFVCRLCNSFRNNAGFQNTLVYYKKINSTIEQMGLRIFIDYAGFRNYINTYSDILLHLRKSEDAISYLDRIKDVLPSSNDDSKLALNAMIYNRLMINHREHDTEYHIKERDKCLKISYDFASRIKNSNLRDEFTYLNLSDEGYIYYALDKDKEQLLSIWNKCREYIPERLPQKTLNYYRKMIQLSLICADLNDAETFIKAMNRFLNKQIYSSEKLVFQLFNKMANALCLILKDPIKNEVILNEEINDLLLLAKLKGGGKEHDILNLRAIISYYNEKYLTMLDSFKEAYYILNNILSAMHLKVKIELLSHNILYACVSTKHEAYLNEIFYDKTMEWIEEKTHLYQIKEVQALGTIYTVDHNFNLPLVV